MLKYVVLLALVPFVLGGRIDLQVCRDQSQGPLWIDIEGCEGKCTVKNGSELVVTGELLASYDSQTLLAGLRAWVSVIEIPYTLPEESQNGCNGIVDGCPLKAGEIRKIYTELSLSSPIAATPNVEFSLKDENGNVVICARFDITITN